MLEGSKYRFARVGSTPGGQRQFWTLAQALTSLETELQRLGAVEVHVSTNYSVNRFGGIREDRRPADQGVAVYFELKGKPMVMAQDAHQRAEENLRSLALAIEAMRALERHGGGAMMEKAFTGFTALPPPPDPWQVLGLGNGASADAVQSAWKHKIRAVRMDRPAGDHPLEAEINSARDACLKLLGEK
jgi:hypothetical protein